MSAQPVALSLHALHDPAQVHFTLQHLTHLDDQLARALLQRSGQLALDGAEPALRSLLALLGSGYDWRLDGSPTHGRLPVLLVSEHQAGSWLLRLFRQDDWLPWLKVDGQAAWASAFRIQRLYIDLSGVDHLRSVIIGWLLTIQQQLDPASLELINVDPRALAVLQQMRLAGIFHLPRGSTTQHPGVVLSDQDA